MLITTTAVRLICRVSSASPSITKLGVVDAAAAYDVNRDDGLIWSRSMKTGSSAIINCHFAAHEAEGRHNYARRS